MACLAVAAAWVLAVRVVALDGQPGLHDPSTVIAESARFLDENDRPIRTLTATLTP